MDFTMDPTLNETDSSTDMPCCAMLESYASQAAMQLRLMMNKVEGEDKCTLCKAAEELEKASINQSTSWNSSWWIMILAMLMCGSDFSKNIDMDALNAYMDIIKKKAQEGDCKLQNES